MNFQKLFVTGCLFSLAAIPMAVSAGNTYIFGNVSGWTVHTDPEHNYRCFAEVQYEGGTLIRLGFNSADAQLYVSVADPTLNDISNGETRAAQLIFDGEESLHATAVGAFIGADSGAQGIRLKISPGIQESFTKGFKARQSLEVSIAGLDPLWFSLAGSYRATQLLEDCQTSMGRVGQSSD